MTKADRCIWLFLQTVHWRLSDDPVLSIYTRTVVTAERVCAEGIHVDYILTVNGIAYTIKFSTIYLANITGKVFIPI